MDDYKAVVKGSSLKKTLKKAKNAKATASKTVNKAPEVPQAKVTKPLPKKTAAEIAAEKARQRIQSDKIRQLAKKSHKDHVADYNAYLSKLSEHHDIPKVGPG